MFILLKDCLEEKILLERKLAVALGLLATCKLDLEACRGEEEERDEALFNFPLGNNNDEPPPPYVRIKTFTHNSYWIYIYVK